jgi:hypothetical protein
LDRRGGTSWLVPLREHQATQLELIIRLEFGTISRESGADPTWLRRESNSRSRKTGLINYVARA